MTKVPEALTKSDTKEAESYDKYQAENDLRSLTEAKRIQADPARMAFVRRCAKEKLSEMADLKKLAAG